MGLREHSSVALLPAQKNQTCGQQEFWDMIFCMGFKEQFSGFAANSPLENQACRQRGFWGLISHIGFRECSSVVLLLGEPSLLLPMEQ
jgi:hypothetical protein